MFKLHNRHVLLAATTLAGLGSGAAANAQQAAEPAQAARQGADEGAAGEIIVTAQRRAERLEDVPLSVTALQGEALARSGVQRMQDLGQVVVGAQVNRGGAFTQPSVRGVTTLTSGIGFENNTAVYIDGFYQPDTISINGDLANLASIQVLKGPQGTLYGRNALAGALVLDTLAPADTYSARGLVSYGRFNDTRAQAYVTGPISEKISFGIAGYYRRSDGYIRDLGATIASKDDDYDAGPLRNSSIRTKLQIKPTDDLTVTLAYNRGYVLDARGLIYTINAFPSPVLPQPPARATERDTATNNFRADTTVRLNEFNSTIKLDTDIGVLSSYTGYAKRKFAIAFDFDGSKAPITYSRQPGSKEDTFQQGLDFAITAFEGLDLVVGALYYNDKTLNVTETSANNTVQRTSRVTLTTDALAFYTDATLRVTDRIFLTGGLRYSSEDKHISYFEIPGAVTNVVPPAQKNASFSAFTPRLAVRFELGPRTNIYASYSQGFRSGAFNPSPQTSPALVIPVQPEKVKAYEIGFKTASSRLRFDAAAYFYDYRNLQVGVTLPNPANPSGLINLISNAKKAQGYGGEAQLTFTPASDINLRAGVAYTHARYKDFKNAAGIGLNSATQLNVPSQTQDWSGHQMSRAPTWTANAGAEYGMAFAGGRLLLSANASYSASYVVRDPSLYGPLAAAALANKQRYRQGAFAILNGQVNWTDPSEHFTIGLYGDNITNTRYRIVKTGGAFGDFQQFSDPASYGVRLGVEF